MRCATQCSPGTDWLHEKARLLLNHLAQYQSKDEEQSSRLKRPLTAGAEELVVLRPDLGGDGAVLAILQSSDEVLGPAVAPLQAVQQQHHAVVVAARLPLGLDGLLPAHVT